MPGFLALSKIAFHDSAAFIPIRCYGLGKLTRMSNRIEAARRKPSQGPSGDYCHNAYPNPNGG